LIEKATVSNYKRCKLEETKRLHLLAKMVSKQQLLKGVKHPTLAAKYTLGKILRSVEPVIPLGTNVFEFDWDVLIVLDACRYDLFLEFAPQHEVYSHIDSVTHINSVASTTKKWIPRTFRDAPSQLAKNTHYVTCTGFADKTLDETELHAIDHVWEYAQDPEYNLTRPEAVTDAAIDAIWNSSAERIVVHYVQPHAPFLHCIGKYNSRGRGKHSTQNVWHGLKEGQFDKDSVWEDYGKNLLRGLDEVQTVVENTDGKIAITSDHGNAFGEWGVYGHPGYAPIKSIRKVPWVELSGLGKREYQIEGKEAMTTNTESRSVDDQLAALGYRED